MTNPTPPIEYDVLTVQGMQDVLDALEQQRAATQAAEADARTAITLMQAAGAVRSLGRAPQAGDPAGTYRVVEPAGDVVDVAWNGAAETARTPALATAAMLDRLTAGTLADLRALPPGAARHVVVLGADGSGDWGEPRTARWAAGEVAEIGGMIVRPAAIPADQPGRWVFGTDILGRVRSSWLGLDRSGGAEASTSLNAALSRYDVLLEHGRYRNNLGVTVPRGRRLIGTSSGPGTCVLDSSGMGGGLTAVTVPHSSSAYVGGTADHWFARPVSEVEIVGPGRTGGTGLADGTWGDAYGLDVAGSMISFEGLVVRGFRSNVVLTPNYTYNVKFQRCVISGGQIGVHGKPISAGVNSGELISFSECFVSGNQTGWQIDDGWEIVAHRTSIDYNHWQVGGARGAQGRGMSLTLIGGHWEWDSEQPAVRLDGTGGPDVRLIGSTFGRIFKINNVQNTTIDVQREHIYGVIAISGLGGQRGSFVVRDADLLHNGMTDLAYSAKAVDNTLYEGGNYYNDTGTALEITLVTEYAPGDGTGGTLSVWCQAASLDNGSGGVPAGAAKIVDDLIPIGAPAGTKRTTTFRVPNMWYYRVETNNYAAVQNVIRRSVPSA